MRTDYHIVKVAKLEIALGVELTRNSMNRREMVALGLASLSSTALSPALAQSRYPERPIRLVVPFSAGGVVDAVAR